MKRILFLFLSILFFTGAYAQTKPILGPEPTKERLLKHQKDLYRKLKKSDCSEGSGDFKHLDIFVHAFATKPSPDLLLRKDFLNELRYVYNRNKDLPAHFSVLYDTGYDVRAYTENTKLYCFYSTQGSLKKSFDALLKYRQGLPEPVDIFRINATSTNLYFAEINGAATALIFEKGELIELNMEEFVKCCWDTYFPEETLDIYYGN